MDTILISTSKFGTAIPNYFKYLGEEFRNNDFSIIFIFDGQVKNIPSNKQNIKYFTYPNKRPTRLKDFIFLCKIMKKEKPILSISNVGSTNIVTIASYIFKVPHRINYIHTSPHQLNIDSKKSNILDWFLKFRKTFILKMNTHIITNSNKMEELIFSFFKLKKNKLSVLPYLIKQTKNSWRDYKERDNSICIVGRLAISKGHKELLYAFKDCQYNHRKLKLLIVGDGPEKKDIKKLVKDMKLEKSVMFFGDIPNKNINTIFSKCLVSISASKSEAFGIVNIESLREGTPILCTDTEGSRDIIEYGKNGLNIDLMKENDLSNKLDTILEDWKYFSLNALDSFEENYSHKNINKHYKILMDAINFS